jgi:hypothetical protein
MVCNETHINPDKEITMPKFIERLITRFYLWELRWRIKHGKITIIEIDT